MAKTANPAVAAAKEIRKSLASEPITLPTGDRVLIHAVTVSTIDAATSRVKDPPIPMWKNPDKDGREEENPNDPKYLRDLAEASKRRGMAAFDVMIIMGIELLDGVPPKEKWLGRLRMMERQGLLDLSAYDEDDPDDLEFMYKKYVAADNATIGLVGAVSGISPEDITAAEESFPGS